MSLSKKFQQRFRELITDYDYKRSDIVRLIPINQCTLSNALSYGIVPSTKTLIRVADFFNVSINFLLGKTEENDFIKAEKTATFISRFESLCLEKKVSHNKVANDCSFDKSNISRWFSKEYTPELEIVELLCDYFNVSPDYLLGRSDYKN